MKRADAKGVRNHRVDRGGLARDTLYVGSVVQPGAWRSHAHFWGCHTKSCLIKNEGGKLKVAKSLMMSGGQG